MAMSVLAEEFALVDETVRSLVDLDQVDGPLAGRCHSLRADAVSMLIQAIAEAARRDSAVADAIARAPLSLSSDRAGEVDLEPVVRPLMSAHQRRPVAEDVPTLSDANQSLEDALGDLYIDELLEVSDITGEALSRRREEVSK